MKRIVIALIALLLCGCSSAGVEFAQHSWDYRDVLYYDNPNLDPFVAESEVYACGAVIGLSPEEIEADIAAHQDDDDDED